MKTLSILLKGWCCWRDVHLKQNVPEHYYTSSDISADVQRVLLDLGNEVTAGYRILEVAQEGLQLRWWWDRITTVIFHSANKRRHAVL